MDADDAALLAAVRDGSRHAFNLLVDRHQQAVRVFLRRAIGGNDADDVAQETFLALWTQARAFRGGSSVRTWLFGIAWRKAQDMQRVWFRRRRRDQIWYEDADDREEFSSDMQRAMEQALASLSREQRAAITLCLAYGLSHGEAAEVMRMPLGTVKSHVARGREKLRDVLGDEQ
jgi:RNA polymerase sigma-70 factor (ECF subfamily)